MALKVPLGLSLRHDRALQYTARQFAAELRWLEIRSTVAYVAEPECNRIIERFLGTLKEECLYVHDFTNPKEARQIIAKSIRAYNKRVADQAARPQNPSQRTSSAHPPDGLIKPLL